MPPPTALSMQKCVSACASTSKVDEEGLDGVVYLATALLFFIYSFCVFELLEEVVPGRLLFATCMTLCFFVAQQLQSLYLIGTWDWQGIAWPCLCVSVLVCLVLQWRPVVWNRDCAKPATCKETGPDDNPACEQGAAPVPESSLV